MTTLDESTVRRLLRRALDDDTDWIFVAGAPGFAHLLALCELLPERLQPNVLTCVLARFGVTVAIIPRSILPATTIASFLRARLHFRLDPDRLATMGCITLGRDEHTVPCLAWLTGVPEDRVATVPSGGVFEWEAE